MVIFLLVSCQEKEQSFPKIGKTNDLEAPTFGSVWIDADIAIGSGSEERGWNDVDDGFALIQLMRSNPLQIRGLSTLYGNTDLQTATRLGQEITEKFYSGGMEVWPGAAGPMALDSLVETKAVKAMAAALRKQNMSILAIGPATNVATLLLLHPDLADSINSVILVAGRRSPNDHFFVSKDHEIPFPDLNFDLDPNAFQVLLQSKVEMVLLPFEISHKVWIYPVHLELFASANSEGKYLAENTSHWMEFWESLGCEGFNPFDVLASTYVLDPNACICEELPAEIKLFRDDTQPETPTFKPYLIISKENSSKRKVTYCYDVQPDFDSRMTKLFTYEQIHPE